MSSSDTLGKIGAGFIIAFGIAALLPFLIVLSTLIGAMVGWLAGALFPETFSAWLVIFRLQMEPYQVGAALGFVSAFFRNNRSNGKSE